MHTFIWCIVTINDQRRFGDQSILGRAIPRHLVTRQDLYEAFREWNLLKGRPHSPAANVFGRDLRAACHDVGDGQSRENDRVRHYTTIDLKGEAKALIAKIKAERKRRKDQEVCEDSL